MAESKQQQQLKEITERLEKGVKELFTSEKYMEYLRVMSQFHNYSFSNTLLIAMQKPDATLVAGYGAWQKKFERNVMKGEKAIKIFAPAPRKVEVERDMLDPESGRPVIDENGEVKKEKVTVQQPYFKVTSVFDVSQTDGKPLPELDTVQDLTASVEGYNIFFEALKRTSKVPMDFQPIEGSSHGFYHQVEKRIAIAEGMSEAQNVKTGIHEIAHSRLHDVDMTDAENGIMVDRRTREVQAESVAYTVCQHYGIDTSEYSFGYIAGWSEGKEIKELRCSMEVIRREADNMIKEIDRHLEEIRRERQQEAEVSADKQKSIIAGYYVISDAEALKMELFDDFNTAIQAYFASPNNTVKSFGIRSTENEETIEFVHCINGIDYSVVNFSDTSNGNNPEVIAVADRVFEALENHNTAIAYIVGDLYFSIKTTDSGYDYTLYSADYQVLDGGVIEHTGKSLTEVVTDILDEANLNHDNFQVLNYDDFMAEVEATNAKSKVIPLSDLTFAEASEKGEIDAWRASRKETEACAEQFNKEFGMAYHERRMPEFLAEMVDKYGMERVKIVLASTIQLADHDGRYYPSTKTDAAKIHIPGTDTEDYSKDIRRFYTINCHPVMVNSAFREIQKMERDKEKAKDPTAVDHDTLPRASVLSKLQEKQKQVKASPAKSEDKKRGIEL